MYPQAERAALRAASPEGWQAAYDAARDLQEALRRATPVSARCAPLRAALARYAGGRVLQMEGVDRPSAGDRAAGRRTAERARRLVAARRARCDGGGTGTAPAPLAMSPVAGEAFFGPVVARAPEGATSATLTVDGGFAGTAEVRGGRVRFGVTVHPGPHDLRIAFTAGAGVTRVLVARGAVLLPESATRAAAAPRPDAALARSLAAAVAGGPRFRAAWVHDLADGRSAGVGADLRFPAASTVKLGLMAAVLARLGGVPERSAYAYDLRAMATWSSNLATNRLLRRFGGAATATGGLRTLGARVSTFPGEYIVGTQVGPPIVSQRVTTARDLGRMLLSLGSAAAGDRAAVAATGLTVHQARLAVGWLAASEQRGDNASLVAGGATPGAPIAQKNGWIRAARLTAAIVYRPRGPAIVTLATYDDRGVGLAAAQALGGRVTALLR
ncbi:MAG TPA: serine hydrolase [Miltoncostaea sp.]|nr:serine hydrolase [Miltoncostaea sp.]